MSFAQGAPTQPLNLTASNVFVTGTSAAGNAFTVQQLGVGNVFSAQTSTGATALIINPSGLVGIGKTNPAYAMDITGDLNFTGTFRQNGTPYIGSQWTGTTTLYFVGNVGINTTSVANPLTVGGTVVATTLNLTNALGTAYGGTGITSFTSGGLLYASSTSALASSGAYTAGQVLYGGGAGSAPGSSSGLFWDSTNSRLGIGTATPSKPLHVWGGMIIGASSDSRATTVTLNAPGATVTFSQNADIGDAARIMTLQCPDLSSTTANLVSFSLQVAPTGTFGSQRTSIDLKGFRVASQSYGGFCITSPFDTAGSYDLFYTDRTKAYFQQNLGIGTASPSYTLQVIGTTWSTNMIASGTGTVMYISQNTGLGTTAGNSTSPMLQMYYNNGNASYLNIFGYRYANGTNWGTASTRIQQVIDVTNQAFIDFNPFGALNGVGMYGSSGSGITVVQGGSVGIGTTNPQAVLDVRNSALIGDYGGSGFYNSNAALHIRRSGVNPHLIFENIGASTGGIAGVSGGMVYGCDQSGYHAFRTGCTTGGDFPSTGTERMRINTTGLGIGITNPSYSLDVKGASGSSAVARFYGVASNMYMYLDTDAASSQVAIQWNKAGTYVWINYVPGSSSDIRWYNSSGDRMTLTAAGALTCANDITAFSDIRHKTNLVRIENALDKVTSINGYTFNRTDEEDKDKRYAGVVAQEILEVLPEVVHKNHEGIYSVAYGNLTALLIEALKEERAERLRLQDRLERLEKLLSQDHTQ